MAPEHDAPLLRDGDPAPGRFVDGVWQGALSWRTQHGPAIVLWMIGAPVFVWAASAPEGARADIDGRPAGPVFRRALDEGFQRGVIEIGADDVVFTPTEDSIEISDDLQPAFALLQGDESFIRALRAPAFAGALYAALENADFDGPHAGQSVSFGQRSAAAFVAALRGGGEDYLDYAWGRGPTFSPVDLAQVNAHLQRIGFKSSGRV